jgi:hypothetical protein
MAFRIRDQGSISGNKATFDNIFAANDCRECIETLRLPLGILVPLHFNQTIFTSFFNDEIDFSTLCVSIEIEPFYMPVQSDLAINLTENQRFKYSSQALMTYNLVSIRKAEEEATEPHRRSVVPNTLQGIVDHHAQQDQR